MNSTTRKPFNLFSQFSKPKRLVSTVALLLLLTPHSVPAGAQTCDVIPIPGGVTIEISGETFIFQFGSALSADGTRVATISNADLVPGSNPDLRTQVFLFDTASSSYTQVTHSTYSIINSISSLSISGDGNRLVFVSTADLIGENPGGGAEVFLYDVSTASLTQLTNSNSTNPFETHGPPQISADGEWVVFLSFANQAEQLFLYEVASTSLTQLTDVASVPPDFYVSISDPTINQDGTRIAFSSNADFTGDNLDHTFEVYVYDVVSDTFTRVTRSDSFRGSFSASMSGDGSRIAFTSESDLTGENPQNDYQIFLADLTAGSLSQITQNSDSGLSVLYIPSSKISLDGTRITFHSQTDLTGGNADRSAETYIYDIPSGSLTQITSSSTLYNVPLSLSADGTSIAYITGENGGIFGLLNTHLFLASCPEPEEQVADLQGTVGGFHLDSGLTTALIAKLNAALAAISAGDTETACSALSSFINQVRAQSGKKLTTAQADELIAAAETIQAQLGCP